MATEIAFILAMWLAGALVAASAHWSGWAVLLWPLNIVHRWIEGE